MVGNKTLEQIMSEVGESTTAYKFTVLNGIVTLSVDGIYGSLNRM